MDARAGHSRAHSVCHFSRQPDVGDSLSGNRRRAQAATISVIVKTGALYTIMVTGSIWEKIVFGKWLFVPAFFWEDVFSMLVLALHTGYLVMLFADIGSERTRMFVALAAYASYVINAGQFLWKLRVARLQGAGTAAPAPALKAATA